MGDLEELLETQGTWYNAYELRDLGNMSETLLSEVQGGGELQSTQNEPKLHSESESESQTLRESCEISSNTLELQDFGDKLAKQLTVLVLRERNKLYTKLGALERVSELRTSECNMRLNEHHNSMTELVLINKTLNASIHDLKASHE